jgi:hypothetical protein
MDAVLIQIADAVTGALGDAALSKAFDPSRAYTPVHNIKDLTNLSITVVPVSRVTALLDRSGRSFNDYVTDVVIQQSLPHGPLTNDQINFFCDPLVFLAEEIVALFYINILAAYPQARCTSANHDPVVAHHHIDEERVFTSVVQLTFRVGA